MMKWFAELLQTGLNPKPKWLDPTFNFTQFFIYAIFFWLGKKCQSQKSDLVYTVQLGRCYFLNWCLCVTVLSVSCVSCGQCETMSQAFFFFVSFYQQASKNGYKWNANNRTAIRMTISFPCISKVMGFHSILRTVVMTNGYGHGARFTCDWFCALECH